MSDFDIAFRALSKVPLGILEASIADTVSELAGQRFVVSVKRLDLEPSPDADLSDDYELTLRLRREQKFEAPTRAVSHAAGVIDSLSQQFENETSSDRTATGLTGRQLNVEWQVGARHALYHHEGHWYHQLRRFPGALFDYNGYVFFASEEEFKNCPELNITQDVHVPRAISSMKQYVRVR